MYSARGIGAQTSAAAARWCRSVFAALLSLPVLLVEVSFCVVSLVFLVDMVVMEVLGPCSQNLIFPSFQVPAGALRDQGAAAVFEKPGTERFFSLASGRKLPYLPLCAFLMLPGMLQTFRRLVQTHSY